MTLTIPMHFERLNLAIPEWEHLTQGFRDRTVFQSAAWFCFLAETQRGEPVFAALMEEGVVQGYFCGMIVRKFGIPILGSPMPGWTTAYMGMNLVDGVPRRVALKTLQQFAFRELGCAHLEIMDRRLTTEDAGDIDFNSRLFSGFEVDLTQDERTLLSKMTSSCRTSIRKGRKNGLRPRMCTGLDFADQYYAQLEDVFGKQRLVPTYKKERVKCLMRYLLPEGKVLPLQVIDPDGRCIASAITIGLNDTAFLWGAASWRRFQYLRPNEMLFWSSMQYWKSQGIQKFDMGGGGEYKRKYGGNEILVPWLRTSKYVALESLRSTAVQAVRLQQRLRGRWKNSPESEEELDISNKGRAQAA